MTEEEKRKFDAWESIRDHAWREFEDKSRAEWRLSFGIWAALLASASALIASGHSTIESLMKNVPPCWFVIPALVIVIGHFAFLWWIQSKLQGARNYLSEADTEMRKLLGSSEPKQKKRRVRNQFPLYIEIFITILLIFILGFVLRYSGSVGI